MSARSVAVGCCTVVLFAVSFAPLDASARSRGGGIASAPARAAPAAVPRASFHRGRHGGHVGPRAKNLGVGHISHRHGKHHHFNHHGKHRHDVHDRRFNHHVRRHTWPADLGVYYGPVYDPGVYQPVQGGPIIVTVNGPAPVPERVAVGRGCRMYAVVVPSESGGERKVTITECNQP